MDMAARNGSGNTPLVSIRVPRTRKDRAMRAARGQGEDMSKAVNRFLDEYAEAYEAAQKEARRRVRS